MPDVIVVDAVNSINSINGLMPTTIPGYVPLTVTDCIKTVNAVVSASVIRAYALQG